MPTDNAEPVPARGWARARWWASALALAALVGLFDWLRARVSLPASARLPYLPWTVVSWMLWVPVVAALSLSVRRLVASGASRSVLVAGGVGSRGQRGKVDAIAASLFLQTYLTRRARGGKG